MGYDDPYADERRASHEAGIYGDAPPPRWPQDSPTDDRPVDWVKLTGLLVLVLALTVFWWMVARGLWWLTGELV